MKHKLLFILLQCSVLAGCMTPIGEPEFSCPNKTKGGACAGPRDIYELTNTRDNLHGIGDEPGFEHYAVPSKDKNDNKNDGVMFGDEKKGKSIGGAGRPVSIKPGEEHVYEAREHSQQSSEHYQKAKPVPQIRTEKSQKDSFEEWPTTTEPMAPEPLAVLNPAKVMRVLIASYKDESGYLNMPGFVYVQVEPETWSVGEAANLRPQRVVPLQVIDKAKKETDAQQNRSRGVSAIEVLPSGKVN